MSKLSFRARALDASKPMPIYLAEELPDLPDYSAINRAVPQMPSGMEKEEECEHHLQRAICTGLIIPTPEVFPVTDFEFYEKCYPPDYKIPKQHIHMQPLWQEQETPEYDMDSEDERWLRQQRHPELTELKFEQMMDKLEKSSGQTVATLSEAKLLLERQDDLVIAVYDYWLNKRLKTQHPLILSVRTESRIGQSTNNPYLAFRRRTEKMQTRKNRKNDESSYEKMLKLRRDLARAATLLDMVARRERAKRDLMRLTALIAERRFNAADFTGQLLAEIAHAQPQYAAVPLGVNAVTAAAAVGAGGGYRRDPYAVPHYPPRATASAPLGVDQPRQREKRPHKRRPRRPHGTAVGHPLRDSGVCTSSEEEYVVGGSAGVGVARPPDAPPTPPDDGPFAFTRKPGCYYELPTATLNGDPVDPEDATKDSLYQHDLDYRHRYTLTSLSEPYPRCVGFARRRLGRGGRVLLDRMPTPLDDLWPHLPFTFNKSTRHRACKDEEMDLEMNPHRHPKELVRDYHTSGKHPWRHAFRRHLSKKSHLWLQDDDNTRVDVKKVKTEGMEVDDVQIKHESERECGTANGLSDISVSDDRTMLDERATRALRSHMRKRSWSACSDSSYDSDSSLLPVEENFRQFFEEVNSKWLHFRPKTPPAKSPKPSSPSLGDELVAVGMDTPVAAELYEWGQDEPLAVAELTLRELRELQAPDADTGGGALDAAPDDLLAENFTGLTDAQLESILAETVADDARRGDDILEELVREVALDPKEHFLSRGQSAASGRAASGLAPPTPAAPVTQSSPQPCRRASFGSSLVSVVALTAEESPLLLAMPRSPDPPPAPEPAPPSAVTTAPTPATPTQHTSVVSTASPAPRATSSPNTAASSASTTPFASKISSAPSAIVAPSPVPAAKIIVEEVNEVPHGRAEARRPRHGRDDAEEVQVAHGVHLKTVHNKHSPLKKHIITSAPHRNANAVSQPAIVVSSATAPTASGASDTGHGQPPPQIVTVAVSENLKVRLQNHLLSAQQATVGLVQNGPLTVSAAHGVTVSGAASVSNAVAAASTGSVATSSTRRVSGGAPVVHLAASALQQKPLQLAPPVVVGTQHTLQHVPPNKLKVVHANALTHTQRAQLLAQSRAAAGGLTHLPAVVSLATLAEGKPGPAPAVPTAPALQLKAAPGSVAQFFEIKGGPLAKGHQLVNVVRQPHPAKATVARFDLNDPKKRGAHVLATFDGTLKSNLTATSAAAGAPRPHRLSLASLDGRHLVRTAIPGVRAPHMRHQIQFKNRTLQVARAEHVAAGGAQAAGVVHGGTSAATNASAGTVVSGQAGSITIATAGKSSALPSTVVANLLQKNVAHLQKGQKIAISGTMGAVGVQPLAANMQAIAFTTQQLKARQARLIAQPRPTPQPEIIEASTSPAGSSSSNASLPADGALDAVGAVEGAPDAAATNGAVRRRAADTMPMEVT